MQETAADNSVWCIKITCNASDITHYDMHGILLAVGAAVHHRECDERSYWKQAPKVWAIWRQVSSMLWVVGGCIECTCSLNLSSSHWHALQYVEESGLVLLAATGMRLNRCILLPLSSCSIKQTTICALPASSICMDPYCMSIHLPMTCL
jgi:hypothetical protein